MFNSFAGEAIKNNAVSCASTLEEMQVECDKEKGLYILTIIVLLATQMLVV